MLSSQSSGRQRLSDMMCDALHIPLIGPSVPARVAEFPLKVTTLVARRLLFRLSLPKLRPKMYTAPPSAPPGGSKADGQCESKLRHNTDFSPGLYAQHITSTTDMLYNP